MPTRDDDDDDEYELEPPDAEVIAAEERRAREVVDATRVSIDIDEIYRDADRQRGSELLERWVRNTDFRFRFQVKHLLIATAVLAIALTLWRLKLFGSTLMLLAMITIAGSYLYLMWQEKRQQQEAERRRRTMYQRQREYYEQRNRPGPASATAGAHAVADQSASETNAGADSAADAAPRSLRLQFSLKQLLIAMTAAAVIFGLVSLFGGPANTATMLGFVALLGLVIHALGFEPPEIFVLGWWLVLVLYIVLSMAAVVWSGFA